MNRGPSLCGFAPYRWTRQSAIPAMNPLISNAPTAPGAFFREIAWGPALFLGIHVLFGATVGLIYGAVQHKPHLIRHSPTA